MSDGDKTVAAQGARRPGSQVRADRREASDGLEAPAPERERPKFESACRVAPTYRELRRLAAATTVADIKIRETGYSWR